MSRSDPLLMLADIAHLASEHPDLDETLLRMRISPTPAALAAGLAEAFSSASAEFGRGERRQTSTTDLNVPVLPLKIALTGSGQWLRHRSIA